MYTFSLLDDSRMLSVRHCVTSTIKCAQVNVYGLPGDTKTFFLLDSFAFTLNAFREMYKEWGIPLQECSRVEKFIHEAIRHLIKHEDALPGLPPGNYWIHPLSWIAQEPRLCESVDSCFLSPFLGPQTVS